MPVPFFIKIFQTIKKLNCKEFGLEICSGEITSKKNDAFFLLACDTLT